MFHLEKIWVNKKLEQKFLGPEVFVLETKIGLYKLELSWGQPKLGLTYSNLNFNC